MREYNLTQVRRFISVMLRMGISLHKIGFTADEIIEIFKLAEKAIVRIVFE